MNILERKRLLKEALLSREYKQGKKYLCKDGEYCCLGVACEVYQKHVGNLVIENIHNTKFYNSYDQLPPLFVIQWFGLPEDTAINLAMLNDSGKTFEEIIEVLEKVGYFVT